MLQLPMFEQHDSTDVPVVCNVVDLTNVFHLSAIAVLRMYDFGTCASSMTTQPLPAPKTPSWT
jgi:hypothetical protein